MMSRNVGNIFILRLQNHKKSIGFCIFVNVCVQIWTCSWQFSTWVTPYSFLSETPLNIFCRELSPEMLLSCWKKHPKRHTYTQKSQKSCDFYDFWVYVYLLRVSPERWLPISPPARQKCVVFVHVAPPGLGAARQTRAARKQTSQRDRSRSVDIRNTQEH